jgi:hypothetical protein
LRKQKLQVQEYVTQLEKQLPGKAEMDALLSDINQAGLGRGLQFELFRPGQVEVKDYYAELPIAIRSAAATTTSAPSRRRGQPVAHRHAAQPEHHAGGRDTAGTCRWRPPARTYRYLDAAEVAEQQEGRGGQGQAGSQEMKTPCNARRVAGLTRVLALAVLARAGRLRGEHLEELQQWMEPSGARSSPACPLSAAQEVRSGALHLGAGGRAVQQPEAQVALKQEARSPTRCWRPS